MRPPAALLVLASGAMVSPSVRVLESAWGNAFPLTP